MKRSSTNSGSGLGLADEVARHDATAPYSPSARAVVEHDAVGERPADRRQRDPRERLPAGGAERPRGLLRSMPISSSTGTTSRTTKGSETNIGGEHHARVGEDHLDAVVVEPRAERAVAAVDAGSGRGRRPPATRRTAGRSAAPTAAAPGSRWRTSRSAQRRRTPCSAAPRRGDQQREREGVQRVGVGERVDHRRRCRARTCAQTTMTTGATDEQPEPDQGDAAKRRARRSPRHARRPPRQPAAGRARRPATTASSTHGDGRRRRPVLSFSICPKMKTEATWVLNGRLPEISTTEPNSPSARAKASAVARQDRRAAGSAGRSAGRSSSRRRPSERGRLLHLGVELEQHRLHGAHDERQRHEQQRQHDAGAACRRGRAERAVRPVQREQRQAGDDRRQRERQVDRARRRRACPRNSSRTSTQAISVPSDRVDGGHEQRDARR